MDSTVCFSQVTKLPLHARFHWLTAPRSAIIQPSPVHTGRCGGGAAALQHIMRRMVAPPEAHDTRG